MPSTSTGTRSVRCAADAATSTSSRNGFPTGGRIKPCSASVGERHRFGDVELEPGRQDSDERFVAQVLDDEPRVRDRLGDDRERKLPLRDLERQPLRRAFGEPQRHARRDACDLGDERRHQPRADRADDTERRVAGLQPLQHREVAPQRVELAADRARPLEHLHAELGRDRAAPVAHEQLHAEIGFELADVLRDVRLHRVQPVRGGRERTFFGDREQRFELADVDDALPGPNRVRQFGHIGMADLCYRLHAFDR